MSDSARPIAVVTGGAHGIGAAIVRELAKTGARVLIVDRDGTAADNLAREVGGIAVRADASDATALQSAFEHIDGSQPGVDILVNNVGGAPSRTLEQMSVADWDDTLALNLRSAFIATRGMLAAMRRRGGGSIVNVASIAAHGISPVGGAAYAASKAGVLALTRQTAYEWAKYRIRANAVCPGPTRTPLTERSTRTDADFPLGRWIEAADVAEAVIFLASDRSAMCSGTVLDVDGGIRLAP